jgi:hypothetical protein
MSILPMDIGTREYHIRVGRVIDTFIPIFVSIYYQLSHG